MKILVTGAAGFVGTALHTRLREQGSFVQALSRRAAPGCMPIGTIDGATDWSLALNEVDAIVHLAARVHVTRDTARDPLSAFRSVNVEGTRKLARQAAYLGVRRFVFLSSIKVNGEATNPGQAYRPEDVPAPPDEYALSKLEAERALWEVAKDSGLEVVIIRPPLVYGPGVKANFETMMRWLTRGVPLPLGAIENRRTLVGLDNLVDLIVTCIAHPAAADQLFMAGDGEDLSTPGLLRRLAVALHVRARLLPVPVSLLELSALLAGRRSMARRLCGNLQVDISKTEDVLGWTPPVPVDEGLRRAAGHFLTQRGS